jgi:acyl-CoA oxidase
MGFTALRMDALFTVMAAQLESFGADASAEETKEILEKLKECHATSSGLKAISTWNCLDTIEKCRSACGGHGYSSYTGLAGMYNDATVHTTWEGDSEPHSCEDLRLSIAVLTMLLCRHHPLAPGWTISRRFLL